MSADDEAEAVLFMARQLAATLRSGTATVADARDLVHLIRQAEGWLLTARRFLDPEVTVDTDVPHPDPTGDRP